MAQNAIGTNKKLDTIKKIIYRLRKFRKKLAMVVHAFNCSTQEAKVDGSL